MSEELFILDTQLPVSEDFNQLNQEGLAYIQEHMGPEWTNLNPGDPGVTILEQVCYALTELGYCTDFPIADILTEKNGKIHFKDQFYTPQQILTTAPVTTEDYRKYLIDGVTGVENAIVEPVKNTDGSSCIYRVFLLVQPGYDTKAIAEICKAAFYLLNKARNLGELFLHPRSLTIKEYVLSGTISIQQESQQYTLVQQMQSRINDYIFPRVARTGYDTVTQVDKDINEILNGPLLKNGYILRGSTGSKQDELNVINLPSVLLSIPGVQTVSGLRFYAKQDAERPAESPPSGGETIITCSADELLFVDMISSRTTLKLNITVAGNAISFNPALILPQVLPASPELSVSLVYGTSPDVLDRLPQGIYRDINNYYTIQNTFPAIYGVGPGGPPANASEYEKARTKQLKGYLTLTDQVLANQFSQLANVPRLFSFKNATTAAPSDLETMLQTKDSSEKAQLSYPVPYRSFSPTYFFQSLYNVPAIRPLLKNYMAFDFRFSTGQREIAEQQSWDAYKDDPYNGYMGGLMQIMRREDNNFERRNAILDHLLARHGESPLLLNALIEGPVYTGNILKDQVVIKSLYLQNLGVLAYNRQKGFNYTGAALLKQPELFITASQLDMVCLPSCYEDTIDFIFYSEKVDELGQVKPSDIINFSAAELKLFLLFGLRVYYSNFLIARFDELKKLAPDLNPCVLQSPDIEVRLAYWLMEQRKGVLFIETNLLLYAGFDLILAADRYQGTWYYISGLLWPEVNSIADWLNEQDAELVKTQIANGFVQYNGVAYALQSVIAGSTDQIKWLPEGSSKYSFGIPYAENEKLPFAPGTLLFLLPDYVPPFNSDAFGTRLRLFFENELPVTSPAAPYILPVSVLWPVAEAFIIWYNSLQASQGTAEPGACRAAAHTLMDQLKNIFQSPPHTLQ